MDMNGSQRIEAPRDTVWKALNDPDILRQCIPGCEEVQKLSDTEMTAKVVAKVGPVSAKFSGKVTLSDLDPPNGYTITGEGAGGAAGFGKGGAKVTLEADGAATLLSYSAHAQVGGKLAQIGSRLVDATARKMADDFFTRFTALVGAPATEEAALEAAAEPVAEPVPRPDGAATTPRLGAAAPVSPAPISPAIGTVPPELPLPVPALRGRGNFYFPWAALVALAILLIILNWMN